jgi:hypothetical protein
VARRPTPPLRPLTRPALALAALGLTVGAAGCTHAAASGNQDTRAWRSTVLTMQHEASYRFAGDVVTGAQKAHLAGAFRAPDRVQQTVTTSFGAVEVVLIGKQAFRRPTATGPWERINGAAAGDPRLAFAELATATAIRTAPEAFTFKLTGDAAAALVGRAATVTGTARVADGRVAELHYTADGAPAVTVDIAYSGFGAGPPITAPG